MPIVFAESVLLLQQPRDPNFLKNFPDILCIPGYTRSNSLRCVPGNWEVRRLASRRVQVFRH